ncbi:TIGR03089 family protein [Cryptosporangium phraense]|uniref:TIGR03089 family protein n=1 Tax=Cryptosporangium phraense TaxID=2593070 RepID=A0A545AYP2_9ACTN|nr:TIGR03089 family protein [Cryptosporangium phraense]TQS46446.1 TIGR03089 family protein [Cryptosporangium phraense]
METPDGALRKALADDPGRPLITMYDDRTGERVELSVATVDNWVSKTANLLQEADAATAAVLLPAHWQTAVVLLGCWRAGVAVGYSPVPGNGPDADVVFVAADRADEAPAADEVWALSLAPLAAPLREVPPGALDYAVEVRGHGDRFTPYAPLDPGAPGLIAGDSLAELGAAGRARAADLGLEPGGRLLVTTDEKDQPSPVDWLLAPVVAGAGLVLVRHPDPARIDHLAETERVTVRL